MIGDFVSDTMYNSVLKLQKSMVPNQLQQSTYALTSRRFIQDANIHNNVNLRCQLQGSFPLSSAVNGDIGNGLEQVNIMQLQAYHRAQQKKQQQQQQHQEDDDDDTVPAFALPPSQPHFGSANGARSVKEINSNFLTNSNKRKAPVVTHHRERRNNLGASNPMSAQMDKEEDEIEILANNCDNNNPLFSPREELIDMFGIDHELANTVLQQNGGNVQKAALFLTENHAMETAPPVETAPVQQVAKATSPRKERAGKLIMKFMLDGKNSPTGDSKKALKALANKTPVAEALITGGIQAGLSTQEHAEHFKSLIDDE